ncbi:DNA polymerase II [Oceaniserpentilla sp. 4NH20-0058]|uniref:DNA polymerase II n=1 Tax=Oceaniserpentilla sp. 4NH20-0058 TaxID=3127660 RepID=UPI003102082D
MHGFILSQKWQDIEGQLELSYWVTTDQGAKLITMSAQESVCFCPSSHMDQIPELSGLRVQTVELKHFNQKPVCAIYCNSHQLHLTLRKYCQQNNIPIWEADIKPSHRYLMERFIKGSLQWQGQHLADNPNHWQNPKLKPSQYQPNLKVMSMDIETSMPTKEKKEKLYSIGFVTQWQDENGQMCNEKQVYMLGHKQDELPAWLNLFKTVRELLNAANQYVQKVDPDVIIGWNVINFDFKVLQRIYHEHGVPFHWTRDGSQVSIREGQNNLNFVDIAGRVIVDGIDALRNATYHFESFSLDFVGHELLGKGKNLQGHQGPIEDRGKAISDLFETDKIALATYNANDCQLVLDIFEHTQILQYLIQRSFLTGHLLDRVGGSVAAFEYLYLPMLHRAGYIAPNLGEGFDGFKAPGGFVMDSRPGLYKDVLVLDFKSLYPSIIRTFKIDPMGLIEGLNAHKNQQPDDTISGFHDAYFHRKKHFLPDIITQLWAERDEAKKQNNAATSQAIKIIMNSFYGILGSTGCRFFDARLASAITERGHDIIQTSAKWIEQQGYEVIYGDTDSVFVSLHTGKTATNKPLLSHQASTIGQTLQAGLNTFWQNKLHIDHGIQSQLEIEFESHYQTFLMPTIRGSEQGSKKRYAGMTEGNKLIFKGLEAVRSDWTALAKDIQTQLYTRIFKDLPYKDYLKSLVMQLHNGNRDEELIYKKRIRKPLSTYVKNIPPQIQAAKHADHYYKEKGLNNPYENGGWIKYTMTKQGPIAIECLSEEAFQIDYNHYLEKQITPVVDGILYFLNERFCDLISPQQDIFS